MNNLLSDLWTEIWRMGKREFSSNLLCILWFTVIWYILFVFMFMAAADGPSDSWVMKILDLFSSGWILSYFISVIFLAKRFQDCWICGVRAFLLWIVFLIILICLPKILLFYFWGDEYFNRIYSFIIGLYLHTIVLIVMCFKKWDEGPNKYGDAV